MEVYRLGYNKLSTTGHHVIITIQLVDKTDMTNFQLVLNKYKGTLNNDFYFPYKIDKGKVIQITSLNGAQTFSDATVETTLHGPIIMKKDTYFKIKHHDYNRDADKDNYALNIYKYKAGVLNTVEYATPYFTGVQIYYTRLGKIDTRIYYKHGTVVQRFKYYNNPFNTMKSVNKYRDDGLLEALYEYDYHENLVRQTIYKSDGSVMKVIRYNGIPYKSVKCDKFGDDLGVGSKRSWRTIN